VNVHAGYQPIREILAVILVPATAAFVVRLTTSSSPTL